MLGTLLETISSSLADFISSIEVVSLTDNSQVLSTHGAVSNESSESSASALLRQTASVWLSARTLHDTYMDPIKLQGLIGLNIAKVLKPSKDNCTPN